MWFVSNQETSAQSKILILSIRWVLETGPFARPPDLRFMISDEGQTSSCGPEQLGRLEPRTQVQHNGPQIWSCDGIMGHLAGKRCPSTHMMPSKPQNSHRHLFVFVCVCVCVPVLSCSIYIYTYSIHIYIYTYILKNAIHILCTAGLCLG